MTPNLYNKYKEDRLHHYNDLGGLLMYVISDIGKFAELPSIALHIYNNELMALEQSFIQGWDIEEPLVLSEYITMTPLDMAIRLEKDKVVYWLVEHGANLNTKDNPAFLLAVRYGEEPLIRYLYEHGAQINRLNRVKSNAYDTAYYGKKKNIALIYELGLDIQKYGGSVLRKAVMNHDLQTIDFLLDHGVDINYNQPDMVFPYQATPLTVATRNENVTMVKYLIQRGADVTIAEKNGERPYTIAVINKNESLAQLLKSLEPAPFHNEQNKLYTLQSYKLPKALIEWLSTPEQTLQWIDSDQQKHQIVFLSLLDTVEMKVGRQRYLRLSAEISLYSDLFIVWNPTKKVIGCYDEEHVTYTALGSWADFANDPGKFMASVE